MQEDSALSGSRRSKGLVPEECLWVHIHHGGGEGRRGAGESVRVS